MYVEPLGRGITTFSVGVNTHGDELFATRLLFVPLFLHLPPCLIVSTIVHELARIAKPTETRVLVVFANIRLFKSCGDY